MSRFTKILLAWAALALWAGFNAGAETVLHTPLRQFGGGSLLSSAISPNNALMVSGGGRGGYLWDVATAQIIGPLEYPKAFVDVCFSPWGTTIATGTADGKAILWDVATRSAFTTLTGFPGQVHCVQFSPDGLRLLTGSEHTLQLWDYAASTPVFTMTYNNAAVTDVDYSANGDAILSAWDDGKVILWNARTGQQSRVLNGHTEKACQARFTPDGTKALTVSYDNTAIFWDLTTGGILKTYTYQDNVYTAAISPDGDVMLTLRSDGTVSVYSVASMNLLGTISTFGWQIVSTQFLSDGLTLLSGSISGDLYLWDLITGEPLKTYAKHTPPIFSGTISPDGSRVLLGLEDFRATIYDTWTGEYIDSYDKPIGIGSVTAIAYAPSGSRILAGNYRRAVLWDAATRDAITSFYVSSEWVHAVAFSNDETRALTGGSDGKVVLWTAEGGTIRTLLGHTKAVMGLAFSPDGKKILSGSRDGTAILWNAETGGRIKTITDHHAEVLTVAFSPNGQLMLTGGGDRLVRLWNVESGALVRTLAGHTQSVTASAFSPDSRTLITGGMDTVGILWDVQTGIRHAIYDWHTDEVVSVAFTSDGLYAMTASFDGTALLWPAGVRDAAANWIHYR